MNDYEAKVEARRERLLAAAERMQAASDGAYQRARKMGDAIPFGQPILIGHHSEKRDRAYRAWMWRTQDRCLELQRKAQYYRGLADGVGKAGVSSDDPDAVVKLREKLENLEKIQRMMKLANAAIRREKKNGEVAQVGALVKLGFSEGRAADLLKPDFCWRIGFADFETKNNNANIRRIKARIEQLGIKQTENVDREYQGSIRYVEDTVENRVMLFFPGKPERPIREMLKGRGFRWSPTRSAWVRQLNNSAKWNATELLEKLAQGTVDRPST